MPNVAAVLKEEIRRLSRKEIRSETSKLISQVKELKKTVSTLKREKAGLESRIGRLERGATTGSAGGSSPRSADTSLPADADGAPLPRFSPAWVAKDRKRLGLSGEDYGRLCGVSRITIWSWEKGRSRPQSAPLRRWGKVRQLSRKKAYALLDAMDAEEE